MGLKRTGIAELPLHGGRAPQWLVKKMRKLAKEIVTIILNEYDQQVFLHRISDPYWFQALGCVLGYDWHSSGVTTVLTSILKTILDPREFGLAVCGGKGKASRKTPQEIDAVGDEFGFSTEQINRLRYTSRISAKVDNTAIQAGYPLYHHAFVISEGGEWAVIQQGINTRDGTARRYHWLSRGVQDFVVEPHEAVVGDTRRERALNMTAKDSEGCRKASVDLAKEKPKKVWKLLKSIRPAYQKSLVEWIPKTTKRGFQLPVPEYLSLPRRANWKALQQVYDYQPEDYEQLLNIKRVGPATIRGLALIAELVYGERACWQDPVKYSFAYGGKDGVPFPVNEKAMDESISILKKAVESARLGDHERLKSISRLKRYVFN